MPKTNNLQDYLKDLYEGISSRKPDASKNPQDFRHEIENLVFTGDADAIAADIRADKTAYINDIKVTGTIEDYDGSVTGEAATYTTLQSNKPTPLGWEVLDLGLESDRAVIEGNKLTLYLTESSVEYRRAHARFRLEMSKAAEGSGFKITSTLTNSESGTFANGCTVWYHLYNSEDTQLDGGSYRIYDDNSKYFGWDGFELDNPDAEFERQYVDVSISAGVASEEFYGTVTLIWEAI